jgi:hypothetical protein
MRIIVMRCILQRECNIEVAPDVLDTERGKTLILQRAGVRQLLVSERTHQIEIRIELFDLAETEIGCINGISGNSKPFVDGTRTYSRAIYLEDGMSQINAINDTPRPAS